jgi:hypothetical protein
MARGPYPLDTGQQRRQDGASRLRASTGRSISGTQENNQHLSTPREAHAPEDHQRSLGVGSLR